MLSRHLSFFFCRSKTSFLSRWESWHHLYCINWCVAPEHKWWVFTSTAYLPICWLFTNGDGSWTCLLVSVLVMQCDCDCNDCIYSLSVWVNYNYAIIMTVSQPLISRALSFSLHGTIFFWFTFFTLSRIGSAEMSQWNYSFKLFFYLL
jgi:hypothetical protein